MKSKLVVTMAFSMLFTYITSSSGAALISKAADPASDPSAPQITAEAAIVADADTGYIYYNKNMHQKMYPASITKILTGLVAVENGHDSDIITINGNIGEGMPSDAARIYLEDGEVITQEEALYTMFLASANDSANALALHIGGTIEKFVNMMNERAKELGAVDSHFSNPSGLPDKNNVTSAYDMAIITKKALQEPALMKYFGAKSYTMPATNKREPIAFSTMHKMMKNTIYKYEGTIAGKTGWETMSGHTLVTAAKRNGRTLICVVLKSSNGNTVYKDTRALLDYAFAKEIDTSSAQYLASPLKKVQAETTSNPIKNVPPPSSVKLNAGQKDKDMAGPAIVLICSVCLFILLISFGRKTIAIRKR